LESQEPREIYKNLVELKNVTFENEPKQVFPKVAAGFGSKNLLDKGS